jgi:hypothetical protein
MSSEQKSSSQKIDPWEIIKSSFLMYKKYFVFVIVGGLFFLGISYLLLSIFPEWNFLATLITLVLQALIYTVFIRYIAAHESGHAVSLQEAGRMSSKYILPGLIIYILVYIIVTLGFFLLIIPGVIFGIIFSQTFPLVVLEGKPVRDVFALSGSMTKGNRINILHATWGTYFPLVAGIILLGILILGYSNLQSPYISGALTLFSSMLTPILSFAIYNALKKLH